MPGAPLSLPEREEISVALIEDREMPWAVIAARVGRHPTTIAREVTAAGGRVRYRRRSRKGGRNGPGVGLVAAVSKLAVSYGTGSPPS